jgi:hypothetical protein
VNKETILIALKEEGVKGLIQVLNADALITDEWASLFIDDYSKNTKGFLKARTLIESETKFSSTHSVIYGHKCWNDIESPACLLVMMYTDPSWTEVLKSIEMFNPIIDKDDVGKFDRLKVKAIKSATQYFDLKVRTENLEKLI